MASKFMTLALAGLATAAPLASSDGPCLSADEFSLTMRTAIGEDAPYAALTAIDNGEDGVVNIVAEKPASSPGTPVYMTGNGETGDASLFFDITSSNDCETDQTGDFAIYVGSIGELYGVSNAITAFKDYPWPHFFVNDGSVEPMRTAASQQWYACNKTIQGEEYLALSWGIYNSNGSYPYGCLPTNVEQKFNIPCSLAGDKE